MNGAQILYEDGTKLKVASDQQTTPVKGEKIMKYV